MTTNFNELGISSPILQALEAMGFTTPTEVQSKTIPHILNQEDLIVRSKTGSGKTAVFGVSILQLTDPAAPGPEALILTPTRELAVQVDTNLKQLAKFLPHKTMAVYGQHSINVEVQALKKGVTIVTGTPGRVFDHISHKTLSTGNIRFLVLDEADRMLDMGFLDQVEKIIRMIPKKRITLLFSATIPEEVHKICRDYMKSPVIIEIESQTKTVDTINQAYYRVEKNEKRTQLNRLLLAEQPESCIIFCNTRIAVDQVQSFLTRKGYNSQALHGDIPQSKRLKTIQQFKQGDFHLLVATDVAARGIHIEDLSLVINYDVPVERDSYVHRIGRTGRAGKGGRAITLVTGDDIMTLYEIEEHIGALIEEAALPSEEDYKKHKAGAEKWLQENSIKPSEKPAAQPKGLEAPRKPSRPKPPQRGDQEHDRNQGPVQRRRSPSPEAASERKPSGVQGSNTAPRQQPRPARSTPKPAQQARPPQIASKPAAQSPAFRDIPKRSTTSQPVVVEKPVVKKSLVQRVLQRLFGK